MHTEQRLGSAGLLWDNVKGEDYDVHKLRMGINEKSFFVDRKTNRGLLDSPNFRLQLLTCFKFADGFAGGGIGDDHLPFVAKGVNVVHLITFAFGRFWHQLSVSHLFTHAIFLELILSIFRMTRVSLIYQR
jgi:glutaminyl-peptide cyclotransferase